MSTFAPVVVVVTVYPLPVTLCTAFTAVLNASGSLVSSLSSSAVLIWLSVRYCLQAFPGFPLVEALAFGFQRFLAGFQIFFSCVKVAHALGTLGALTGKPICNDGI